MLTWTSLLTACCALGGLLAAEGRQHRGSSGAVPPGAYCGPCDIRACPTIQAESCPGLVVKDECNCCPVCQDTLTTHDPVEDLNVTAPKNESGCASVQCPRMQICVHNIQGLPLCRCPSVYHCRQFKRKPVCGRDGNTYKNRCYLQMTECSQGKKIRVAYVGKCRKGEKGTEKEERRRKKKERRKNRKRFNKQRKKDRHIVDVLRDESHETDDTKHLDSTPPSLPPLDHKTTEDISFKKMTAKERRRQRRKERQKKRKLRKREKRRRQRRRSRRSCLTDSQ